MDSLLYKRHEGFRYVLYVLYVLYLYGHEQNCWKIFNIQVHQVLILFDRFLNAIEYTSETSGSDIFVLGYKTTKGKANSNEFSMNNIIFYNNYAHVMIAGLYLT